MLLFYMVLTGCASNIYLPSCTYYVPEFSAVSSFLPQGPSRQITYPYSTNLSQVQPVRDVSYGLDPSSKWHHRANYASCYSGEDLVHRDCLPPSTMTEILMKNESVYSHHHHHHQHHPNSSHPSTGFYTGVGKNNVLPQGFDRFFETAYCSTDNQSEHCLQKSEMNKLETSSHQPTAVSAAQEPENDPEDEEEHTNSGSIFTMGKRFEKRGCYTQTLLSQSLMKEKKLSRDRLQYFSGNPLL
uniref:Homeobox C11a n=1 Tax=Cyprinus carpio TaxID=7962 RepID=A0A8C1X255_CYPCA